MFVTLHSNRAKEESKDVIIDPIIQIHIKESNHVEEFCIEAIKDTNIFCKDLISHEDEELTKFAVALKIK